MDRRKPKSLLRVALLLVPLALTLGGCETLESLNPFDEQGKKTPLAGDRRPVFPEGVPGVQYNAPPQQPTNSNISIQQMQQSPENNPDAQQQQQAPQRAPNANTGDDPWAGQRR